MGKKVIKMPLRLSSFQMLLLGHDILLVIVKVYRCTICQTKFTIGSIIQTSKYDPQRYIALLFEYAQTIPKLRRFELLLKHYEISQTILAKR